MSSLFSLFPFSFFPFPFSLFHFSLFLVSQTFSCLQKILIIRFSSIGDIVLTTPVIRCLREQLPGAEIHFLTKEKFYPVIRANPHIDRFHLLKGSLTNIIRDLKKEHFDFIVDLHRNLRTSRVKMALRRPSATFDKLNIEKWLLVNLKVDRLPGVHIVDRYFRAVTPLGVVNDNQGLEYFIPDEDLLTSDDLPASHREGFVALVIGGKHRTKMLPADQAIRLCRALQSPVILLGGEEDRQRGDLIREGGGDHIFNACGFYNINQSASVIAMASRVVTNDTGLMHIAAAFSKEIHSLWGNTIPGFGMYPYMPGHDASNHIWEVRDLPCRPCSKIGFGECPKKHFRCMTDLDMEELAKRINAGS